MIFVVDTLLGSTPSFYWSSHS